MTSTMRMTALAAAPWQKKDQGRLSRLSSSQRVLRSRARGTGNRIGSRLSTRRQLFSSTGGLNEVPAADGRSSGIRSIKKRSSYGSRGNGYAPSLTRTASPAPQPTSSERSSSLERAVPGHCHPKSRFLVRCRIQLEWRSSNPTESGRTIHPVIPS